ncbi:glycosyltransferase family 1 [Opitutaceae bacterium TAV5]|nr:glycosyltransferase family 1 [Opitutaceae bacterium TAV5]
MKSNSRFTSFSPPSLLPFWCISTAVMVACVNPAFAQKLETIALYDFNDPTRLFKDVSGNNRHLSEQSAVSQSTTEYSGAAPTTVSAYFNGTQNGAAREINFSSYTALTFDWYMKANPADLSTEGDSGQRVLLQTGFQEDVTGGVSVYLRKESGNILLRVVHRTSTGWIGAHFLLDDLLSWNNYTLTIDNSKTSKDDHISLFINGVSQTAVSSTYTGLVGSFVSGGYTYLGNNQAKNRPFIGYLQNFEIYSGTPIPEPATAAMLIGVAAAVLMLAGHRYRCM